MPKRVLDIGNCVPDHRAIAVLITTHFDAQVVAADQWQDACEHLRRQSFDLVLVNRKLDIDYSDGIEVICKLKADPELCAIPVMMVTNFAEHQQQAIRAGGVEGFGKQSLRDPATREKLAVYLS
jgi:CheY-like chemotaxis protein